MAVQEITYSVGDDTPLGDIITSVTKISTQVFNSVTLTDVTDLDFAIKSDRYYGFEFHMAISTTVANSGIDITITVPSFVSFAVTVSGTNDTGGGVGSTIAKKDEFINISGNVVTFSPTASGNYYLMVRGGIKPDADGTLQLRAAAETVNDTVEIEFGMGLLLEATLADL